MPSRTARFGGTGVGDVLLSVKYESRADVFLTDKVTRYFLGGEFQRQLASANEAMVTRLAEYTVAHLEQKIAETGRPQRGNKALEYTLLDERNYEVTASGFVFGRPSWLDESPAKLYWRRIEEGDPVQFTARVLFTSDFNKFFPPLVERHKREMRMPNDSRGAPVRGVLANVGPYPAYRYFRHAQRRFREFDVAFFYSQAGVPIEQLRSGKKAQGGYR